MSDDAAIAGLIREGKHAEAAELLLAAKEHERAAELFAQAWKFESACQASRAANNPLKAYQYAMQGELRELLVALRDELAREPEQAKRAAELAIERGRFLDAAQLYEAAGELASAASAYTRAGDRSEAGRCLEAIGQWREAGKIYEEHLAEAPDDGAVALRLGAILFRYGLYEGAARVLQRIAVGQSALPALRLLVACFHHLQMNDAARDRYLALRASDPSLPDSVADFVKSEFAPPNTVDDEENATWVLGRYRVMRTLGAGATGRVLLAKDTLYDRDVAIKVLRVSDGSKGRDAFARFSREARLALAFDHPNIVKVYEFAASTPALVMEWMRGGTLDDRLANGAVLSRALARHVLRSLLNALSVVHRHAIVHRDLKPANVFFDEAGSVKLGDFGVAHLMELGSTLTGAMLGSVAYMAPEQITGRTAPTPATDLYALGVITHRMLTGVLPFAGPDFVTAHLNEVPTSPSTVNAKLGRDFDAFTSALLEKDPGKRPASADEALALLNEIPVLNDMPSNNEIFLERRPERAVVAASSTDLARFVADDPTDAERMHDRVLGRAVRVLHATDEERTHFRKLAAIVHPNLQLVIDIDEVAGTVVLEEARNDPSSSFDLASIEAALASLHRGGLLHGGIDASMIARSRGRSVLLLPRARIAEANVEDDRKALARVASELGRHRA